MRLAIALLSLVAALLGLLSIKCYYDFNWSVLFIACLGGCLLLVVLYLQNNLYRRKTMFALPKYGYHPFLIFICSIGIFYASLLACYNYYNFNYQHGLGTVVIYMDIGLALIFYGIQLAMLRKRI